MNRRDFLKTVTLAGLGWSLGGPSWALAPTPPRQARRLVVIHLFGGNDGLNTIVPCEDPHYRQLRPQLALPARSCLQGAQGLFFHPALAPLMAPWEKGELCVVNGVGYEQTQRSHFLSSDIWNGGGPDREHGWLGRAADLGKLTTVQLARSDQGQALRAEKTRPLCVDPERTALAPLPPELASLYQADPDLGPLYSQMCGLEKRLPALCEGEHQSGMEIARSLQWIADLMPQARIFHTTMSGFDTHSNQLERHAQVLAKLASAVSQFWQRLERDGYADSTLVMIFSEFGRRVEENRSGGTDHGSAGPVFLLGKQVQGGFLGQYPDLSQLKEGDLRHSVDFRQIYSGILQHWLGLDAAPIVGKNFQEQALPWWS